MDCGFVWDEKKYQQVVKKHNIRFYEVVSAFDDPQGYEIPDPGHAEDRWLWVGQAVNGRLLAVVYSEEELPLYRLITAFEVQGVLSDEYKEKQRV